MNEEVLNIQIRKFLKKVGVQSQREIEHAVRRSFEKSSLVGIKKLEASMLLEIPSVEIKVSIEGEIKLEWFYLSRIQLLQISRDLGQFL